jgi:hypothetical protein
MGQLDSTCTAPRPRRRRSWRVRRRWRRRTCCCGWQAQCRRSQQRVTPSRCRRWSLTPRRSGANQYQTLLVKEFRQKWFFFLPVKEVDDNTFVLGSRLCAGRPVARFTTVMMMNKRGAFNSGDLLLKKHFLQPLRPFQSSPCEPPKAPSQAHSSSSNTDETTETCGRDEARLSLCRATALQKVCFTASFPFFSKQPKLENMRMRRKHRKRRRRRRRKHRKHVRHAHVF